jgi:hypothetical protein
MDASQITKLLQIQNTRYINRNQTVDSSTLTWKNQIQSSKYIKGVPTCDGQQNCNVPTNPCCADQVLVNGQLQNTGINAFGGSGRTTAIQTGSPQQFLNVLAGSSGSGGQIYSSESITLQKAGKESCGVTSSTAPIYPANSYVVLPGGSPAGSNAELQNPSCSYLCTNTNGPVNGSTPPINNNLNPYLPAFDTYYALKNPSAQCINCPDQNQKHFVKQCHSRFPNANNGENAVFSPDTNTTYLNPITRQFETNPYFGQVNLDGTLNPIPTTQDGTILQAPHVSLPCINCQWAINIKGTSTTLINSTAVDSAGNVYVTGYYASTSSVPILNQYGTSQTTSSLSSLPATTGFSNMFLIKYSSSGIAQWRVYLGDSLTTQGTAVAVDSNDNVYVTGYYATTTTAGLPVRNASDTASGITLPRNDNFSAAFLIKYSPSGAPLFGTYVDNINTNENSYSIAIDSSNNIYITGSYNSSAGGTNCNVYNGISSGSFGAAPVTLASNSTSLGMFLIKYNDSLQVAFATCVSEASGTAIVIGYGLCLDSSGAVYVTGRYNSTNEPNLKIYNSTNSGTVSVASSLTLPTSGTFGLIFVIKYSSSLVPQLATYVASPTQTGGTCVGYAIASDSSNNIYINCFYGNGALILYNASGNTQVVSTVTVPAPNGTTSSCLLKFNSSLEAIWATYLSAGSNTNGRGISVDSSGNIYTSGAYVGTTTIMNASGNTQVSSGLTLPNTSTSTSNSYIIIYDSSGKAQCATYFEGTGSDTALDILFTSSNVYVVGSYVSTSSVSILNSYKVGSFINSFVTLPITSGSVGSSGGFLIKYSLS